MAKASITEHGLRVKVGWFEALLAVQGSFELPIANLRGATEDPKYLGQGEVGLRSPGAGIPGLLAAGKFRKNGQTILSLWRRGQEIVVVELLDSRWDRLILGCDDAKALVREITKAISK